MFIFLKKHFLLTLFLCIAFFISCSQQNQTTSESDLKAINRIIDDWDDALNAGDLDKIVALYTDDAMRMPPNVPAVVGKESIRAWFKSGFDQNDHDIDNTDEEVKVFGDWALTRGIGIGKVIPKAGGDPIEIKAKYISIRKRQPDGSWKIYCDIYNSDLPL